MKNLVIRTILVISGIVIALILLELGARLLPTPYPDNDPIGLVCDNQLGWRGQPDYQTTLTTDGYKHSLVHNHEGMHDVAHGFTKPADTFRVLLLGDSFTRNHHVNEAETVRHVLEDKLNATASRPIEVISAGISGWGPGQALNYYRLEGQQYQPDRVILMFYLGNDLIDSLPGHAITLRGQNCYTPYFVMCDNQLDPHPWLYAPGLTPAPCSGLSKISHNVWGRLYQHSYLYTQLEPLLIAHQPRVEKLDFYKFYLTTETPQVTANWQLTFALIKQLNQEVQQHGATLGVVVIPPADVVHFPFLSPEKQAAVYQAIPELQEAKSLDLPNQKLAQALAAENVAMLDLLPLFNEHITQTGEVIYFPTDKHWNVAGNRLTAELIATWLKLE